MQNLPASKLQSLVVILAIASAYFSLHLPLVKMYSLQIFALTILVFFVTKRLKGAKIWHIMPDKHSVELALLSFAFVFLIGATGNTHSLFFPLTYVHLFFLVFSASTTTAIAAIISLLVFHYGLEPELTRAEVSSLLSIAIIGMLLLFAKKQYDEVQSKEKLLETELEEIVTRVSAEDTTREI